MQAILVALFVAELTVKFPRSCPPVDLVSEGRFKINFLYSSLTLHRKSQLMSEIDCKRQMFVILIVHDCNNLHILNADTVYFNFSQL